MSRLPCACCQLFIRPCPNVNVLCHERTSHPFVFYRVPSRRASSSPSSPPPFFFRRWWGRRAFPPYHPFGRFSAFSSRDLGDLRKHGRDHAGNRLLHRQCQQRADAGRRRDLGRRCILSALDCFRSLRIGVSNAFAQSPGRQAVAYWISLGVCAHRLHRLLHASQNGSLGL